MIKAYEDLKNYLQRMALFSGVNALLAWDQETYMPKGASRIRAKQIALMAEEKQALICSKGFKEALSYFVDLDSGEFLPSRKKKLADRKAIRNIELVYQDWKKQHCLPSHFVARYSEAIATALSSWRLARDENSFSPFKDALSTLITLTKERAHYIDDTKSVYDICLDDYEPGLSQDILDPLFADLTAGVQHILASYDSTQDKILTKAQLDRDKQWQLGMDVLHAMGYDLSCGRQDLSTHPFTMTMHPSDVRITTRFNEETFMEGFSSTIHEGGHALYEQALDKEQVGMPLGEACSLAMHESQSRFWEIYVCKSLSFWKGFYPRLQESFPQCFHDISLEQWHGSLHQVRPGLSRVNADELSYHLHVVIRYNLEKQLFNGDLAVADLPDAWNDAYEEKLGLRPQNPKEGLLQDIHWAGANFGYFPTYSLGTIYAWHIYRFLDVHYPNFHSLIYHRNFATITQWLKDNLQCYGRYYLAEDLIKKATGQAISVNDYIQSLAKRYATLNNYASTH